MKFLATKDAQKLVRNDYIKHIIFDNSDFNNDGHVLQVITIPANTKQRSHFHEKQTEVYYVLDGEADIYFNQHKFRATSGDAFICEPGDRHFIWNQNAIDFKILVLKINKPVDNEDTTWE